MLNTLSSVAAVVADHTSVVAAEQVVSSVITLRCLHLRGNHYLLADFLPLEIMPLALVPVVLVITGQDNQQDKGVQTEHLVH